MNCDEDIFFPFGNGIKTNEHGIGEHLPRIQKHFPETQTIIPLVLPSHRGSTIKELIPQISQLSDNLLIIASVDFSHYLPEATALQNDEISIQTLKS